MALIKKVPAAAMLLLALVVAAAAVNPSTGAADDQDAVVWTAKDGSGRRGGGGHHSRGNDGQHAPLRGLTQCVTTCGTQVTTCFLECYKPPISTTDPVALPVCLLACTNNAMICANSCSSNI